MVELRVIMFVPWTVVRRHEMRSSGPPGYALEQVGKGKAKFISSKLSI